MAQSPPARRMPRAAPVRRLEVGLDGGRGVEQQRNEAPAQLVECRARGVDGDVESRLDGVRPVMDRRRDRSQPFLELLVDHRPALLAHGVQLLPQPVQAHDRAAGVRLQVDALQPLLQLRRREARKQDATHRRHVRRKPRADGDRDAHDPPRRHPHRVDDVEVVEHRDRGGLVHLRHEPLHVRLSDLGEAERRQVREAQLEHAWTQGESIVVVLDVAEPDEREQEASRRRAVEAGPPRDLAERHARVL
jgi:hypothetical protein